MDTTFTHTPAVAALVGLATSSDRWPSQSRLASDLGISSAALSLAVNGQRPIPGAAVAAMVELFPRFTPEAVLLPVRARPAELESKRLYAEVRRLREQVLRGTDEIAAAIREIGG